MPCVAVVMPAFRAADTLPSAAASVLTQSYRSLKLFLAVRTDDDETRTVALMLSDPRVYIVEPSGPGIANARNAALQAAMDSGASLVAFLDADDHYFPDTLAQYVEDWQRGPRPALRHGNWVAIRPGTNPGRTRRVPAVSPELAHQRLAIANYVATSTVMADTEIFSSVGSFDNRYHHAEDWDLWLRIAQRYPLRHVPVFAAQYRETKLARIYPRSFFKSEADIISKQPVPDANRRLARILSHAWYAAYFLRTLRRRRRTQLIDIRPVDVAALPVGAVLRFALSRQPERLLRKQTIASP